MCYILFDVQFNMGGNFELIGSKFRHTSKNSERKSIKC